MNYSLSVVVCSYNRPEILKSCILNLNKIKKNIIPIEIVIIDDGSRELIDEDFKKYMLINKIIYKRNIKNKGLAFSRNKGINESSSEYILICDDDDIYKEPEKINQIYTKMVKNNADIGIGIPTSQSSFKSNKYSYLQEVFKAGITPPVSYQIYRKRIVERNLYNYKIKAGIDIDLWINLLEKNPKVTLLKNCDIESTKHKPNSSLTNNYEKRAENLKLSRNIWENKITLIYGHTFFLRFKKASINYELWFRFLDNLSRYKFINALKIFTMNINLIFFFRLYRYFMWKIFKIKQPVNSHLISYH